jgi:antitoxin (DNA-binding transcriptional repressor) of toxin-antitoxin stability system
MKHVNLTNNDVQLSDLVDEIAAGETVEISRDGRIVARLVPVAEPKARGGIDMAGLLAFRKTLTGPIYSTADELKAWKDEAKY